MGELRRHFTLGMHHALLTQLAKTGMETLAMEE